MKKIVVVPLIFFFGILTFALDNSDKLLSEKIETLETSLTKSGSPSLSEKQLRKSRNDLVSVLKFGKIDINNNDDNLKKLISEADGKNISASIYIIDSQETKQLIPISTTSLSFNGRKQLGKLNFLELNADLKKVVENKEKVCGKNLVIPTLGVEIDPDSENFREKERLETELQELRKKNYKDKDFPAQEKRILTQLKSLENNPRRKKVKFDYCAKPILSSNGSVIGIYLVQTISPTSETDSNNNQGNTK